MLIETAIPWYVSIFFVVVLGFFAFFERLWRLVRSWRGTRASAANRGSAFDPNWCMSFARRTERPMSLIRISLPKTARGRSNLAAPARLDTIASELASKLRCTDFVQVSDAGTAALDVYCLDPDRSGAIRVAERLRLALMRHHPIARVAVTTFPEDGYTLSDLDRALRKQVRTERDRRSLVDSDSVPA